MKAEDCSKIIKFVKKMVKIITLTLDFPDWLTKVSSTSQENIIAYLRIYHYFNALKDKLEYGDSYYVTNFETFYVYDGQTFYPCHGGGMMPKSIILTPKMMQPYLEHKNAIEPIIHLNVSDELANKIMIDNVEYRFRITSGLNMKKGINTFRWQDNELILLDVKDDVKSTERRKKVVHKVENSRETPKISHDDTVNQCLLRCYAKLV